MINLNTDFNKSPLLELKSIGKKFIMGENSLEVLRDINDTLYSGEFIAICGPSGAGKSTLMHLIGGLDNPTSGEVLYNGSDIFKKTTDELNIYRGRELGFVFQSSYLLDDFNSLENVMMPRLILGDDEKTAHDDAVNLIDTFGLKDRLNHYPNELSGGEEQRIAIARAMINNPKILLADEPTGNLDKQNSDIVINMLSALAKDKNVLVLIVTHDEKIAKKADRIIRLEKL